MKTKVYIADTSALRDGEVFSRCLTLVSGERINKINRYAKHDDKIRSLAAGLLLEKAFDNIGISGREIRIGDNGKPYLANGAVFFNLSHSGERAMCSVSDMEVGCDVQKIGEANLKIADRFFSPSECKMLNAAGDESEKIKMFYRLWTLKESYVKAVGTGLKTPLGSFSVTTGENVNGYHFKEYYISDGYAYAVCGKSPYFENIAVRVSLM